MYGRIYAFTVVALNLLTTSALAQTYAPLAGPQSAPPFPPPAARPALVHVYRLVGINAPDHLYTIDPNEVQHVTQNGSFRLEREGFDVLDRPVPGTVPLYRFCTPGLKHLLGTSPRTGAEAGGRLESRLGYVFTQPNPGTAPLYAWYNPSSGDYFYTTNGSGELAPQGGMRYQGVVGYVFPANV